MLMWVGSVAYALTIASIDSAAKALDLPFYKVLNPSLNAIAFPYPLGNVLGGGAHAGPGTPDIQEFLNMSSCCKIYYGGCYNKFSNSQRIKKMILRKWIGNLRTARVMKVRGHPTL